MSNIEQLIRQYVPLPSSPSTKGWYPVLCKVCNDHGKKGPRAAFIFEGESFSYNCFNCGHKARFNGNIDRKISKNAKILFENFNIPESILNQHVLSAIKAQSKQSNQGDSIVVQSTPKSIIQLPSFFNKLSEDKTIWGELAMEYLQHERGIDPSSYQFYIGSTKNSMLDKMWYGRLIIPFYDIADNIIGYQGRALVPNIKPKYRTFSKGDFIIYGYKQIYEHCATPLLITEGFFDALCLNGVAILGNQISKHQADLINKSSRRKIYIPDQFGSGWKAGFDALKEGWEISFPEFGSCKDVNEAYVKYGKLYIYKTIMDNIFSGTGARIRLEMLKKKDIINYRSKK